ncbi:SusC/RagA family TonB-linked outer membrane protein [Flavobacterium pectinovorum]|uniref:SusC/RagA family TonB-linked outer membrane protein n=1 Tax=Flavobacterium pectinovorum TaxID=29533 RepID=A0A502EQD2_9FLAO|nr:SusC/RagA family TonB-linked outer membrane protein [Flavobacterium pectinovorum]TPG40025.1 SusC/RagA family TonB-linked outer membrane protein [Flavobacterium pectinovorum]
MKLKFNGFLVLLLVLMAQLSFAQERTVSGTVSDNAGMPLPGVSVLVKGTKSGTQTDFDGKFSIKASTSQVLVFSYIGMKTQEVAASSSLVNVKLGDAAQELEGVVVTTALGVKREKKSLGYSSQLVTAEQVNSSPTNNFLNNLSGKVAGLEIKANSNFGGSTNIVLRGIKSITGNNQALIVVDGVAVSNANLNDTDSQNGRQGFDFGNAASDIDPNNIESINVLKGAAATALYGSQASNGAIMITTKKGKKNSALGVSVSSTVSVGSIDKTTMPTYQTKYGEGYGGEDSSYTADVFGNPNGLVASTGDDASYGNKFDPNIKVYQWNAFVLGNPNYGKATSWVAAQNNPTSFFQKSTTYTNNVNLSGGDEKGAYNLGFTNINNTGVLPNSLLNKNSLNGNFSRDLSDKLTSTAFFTFTDQNTTGRNNTGYGDNFIGGFRQWWAVNNDIKELEREYNRTGQNITWNQTDPTSGNLAPAFWNNPYFDRYQNYEQDSRTRFLAGTSLSYKITPDFVLLGRATIDYSNDQQELRKAVGSHAETFGISGANDGSGYSLYKRDFMQQTYDFIATYNFHLSENIGAKALGGYTYLRSDAYSIQSSTTGGLASPGLYSLENSNVFLPARESQISYEKSGLYAQLSLDYNKFLFLEGSFRSDKSTALPSENSNYNYYSIGTSLIFSEFVQADWLSLGKVRINYAQVGNDPAAGRLGAKVNNYGIDGNPLFGNSPTYLNFANLKPETQKAWEAGLEMSMFKNRLNFDLSLYKTNTEDQIFNVPQSTSTGVNYATVNAGEIENKGIELALSGKVIKTQDFTWDLGVNWSTNKNTVVSLNQGRDNLLLATFQGGASLNATVGQSYGTLRGTDYTYDANGNRVIDASGFYVLNKNQVIGNTQAKWLGGISNKFSYKNLSLNFLIDIKKGGDIFSLDQAYGRETGIYDLGINDLGNSVRDPLTSGNDSGGVILPGVHADGTANTTRIDASTSGGTAFSSDTNPTKAYVYDGSFVKLREVGFTYSVPSQISDKLKLKGLSFSVIGNNLWIIQKNLPYADPEAGSSAGNIQGFQSGVMPATKVYSFNVKLNF